MADEKSKKRCFVEILSSEESESSPTESDDDSVEEISSSCYDDDDDDEEDDGSDWDLSDNEAQDDEDEDCNDASGDKYDAKSMCDKVSQYIPGGSDLRELKLNECKAYLRRHKLRLSGTKEECIERIKEHWKLKDGNGEVFYPRSSFTIDCTGDVCKGDIVLFHQKVYQISGKIKGNRTLQRRTVAGRIVKESYGAAKQQHTFTVEVLWSRGSKKLDLLFPLLVKGRNLYKMKTFRQPWKNEKERLEVLSEKHRRGAAARTVRDLRRTKAAVDPNKSSTPYKGAKHFHHSSSSRARETAYAKKSFSSRGSSLCQKQNQGFRGSSHQRHPNWIKSNQVRDFQGFPCNYPGQFHSDVFHSRGGSVFTSGLSYFHPPCSEWKELCHGSCNHESFYSTPNSHRWE